MWIFRIVLVVAIVFVHAKAESTDLEQFFASGVKEDGSDLNTERQDRETASTNELLQFMKRSGLFPATGVRTTNVNTVNNENRNQQLLAALQAINRQQTNLGYSQQYMPQNYVNTQQQVPALIRSLPTSNLIYQQQQTSVTANNNPNFAYQQQTPLTSSLAYQQPQSTSTSSSIKFSSSQQKASNDDGNLSYQQPQQTTDINKKLDYPQEKESSTDSQVTYTQLQQSSKPTDDKTASKADRQGIYDYEAHGYDNSHAGGYGGGYSGEHYISEPVGYNGYNKNVHIPVPTVAIKLDPLGFLRLLLQGIPRPILNLNGKVFFGVELGKGVGVGIGKGVAPAPHYGGGGGKVITLG
ncbi:uncharacterized protein LOC118185939 [Stegodyphus dumicola]|uniref:uncharacterized protein LOC118185939 n=1 Tax=Stegodyphus dumicola TaxID=202533 RepID=UPI0015AA6364|nr:uncharacterized protein LOC118185939 [Stegodyphus dumicola]